MLYTIEFRENEHWWGGAVQDSPKMPFDKDSDYEVDLRTFYQCMAVNPMYISDKGRYIWCKRAFRIHFHGVIEIESDEPIFVFESDKSLQETHLAMAEKVYEKDDRRLPNLMFDRPQYCTWMKLLKNQNEKDILAYAQDILDQGLPAGEFIIDGGWFMGHGDWRFDSWKFQDPKGMVQKLHDMGFKVVLWIFGMMPSTGDIFLRAEKEGILLKDKEGNVKIARWWSGFSPMLDLCNPKAREWFENTLDGLIRDFNFDGFKFDGGHRPFYDNSAPYGGALPEDIVHEYPRMGLKYDFAEVRMTYGNAGLRMNFKMQDRHHTWDDKHGLKSLVPCQILMGLLGYPFSSPDMLGGGEINNFLKVKDNLGPELFIRYAECSSFIPIIQISIDFWNCFDEESSGVIKAYVMLRSRLKELVYAVKRECEDTNKPMLRSLNYETQEFPEVLDQYMFGSNILVAPVVDEGHVEKKVALPSGKWLYYGEEIEGGRWVTVKAPIGVLPVFERVGSNIGVHQAIADSFADYGVDFQKYWKGGK